MTKNYLGTGTTNKTPGSVHTLVLPERKIRLVFFGGARSSGDNNAFLFAAKNVIKDYAEDAQIISEFTDSAKKIVDAINAQPDSSIQSLDILCHGSVDGIHFTKGASLTASMKQTIDEVIAQNLCANLYASQVVKLTRGRGLHTDTRVISDINFSKFKDAGKIEIHGCLTASDNEKWFYNNLCQNLSLALYDAGKKNSVVIGHTTKGNPNIRNTTDDKKQDYRHGERRIYHNGNIILTTNKVGRITGDEIKKALLGAK